MFDDKSSDPVIVASARWFWWIAGLSLVNVVLYQSGSDVNFTVGLGLTTLANAKWEDNLTMALTASAVTIAFYFFVGLQAQRGRAWAFYLGLTVYALDAVIFLVFKAWLSVAFHGVAIYYIWRGVLRMRELTRAPA